MIFTKRFEATRYKELCFDAHITKYNNRREKGLEHLNGPSISAAHLEHKAKVIVSGTEVFLISKGRYNYATTRQQTSQEEKDVPCGSGQNILVSPHMKRPLMNARIKPRGRYSRGARGPILIGKGESHEILITLISHVLLYAYLAIKSMLFSCVNVLNMIS